MSSRSLEVKIELGHKAVLKDKPTSEGYTHDWTVFVRGPEGCKIENFVEKVVFKLHDSFPKSRRTLRDPPYQVSESGYAGFNMPIMVYFKTKEEPKKLQFIYDLYLSMDGKPLSNIRCEKLTFHNPPEDFCSKLFKGGATIKDTSAAAAAAPVTAVSPAKKPPTPPQKKSPHLTAAPPASAQFSVLFGAPIIKGQDAKDGKKDKRKDKKDKGYKRDKKDKGASVSGKDEKPKDSSKSDKAEKNEKLTLTLSSNGKTNPVQPSELKKDVVREKKRDNSSSPNQKEKDDLKRKKKKSSSHKDSPDSKKPRAEDSASTVPPTNAASAAAKPKKKPQSKESLTTSPPLANANDVNDVEFTPSPPDQNRKSKTLKDVKNAPNDDLKPSLPPPKSQAPRRVASPADAKKKRPTSNSSALNAMIMEMDADGSSPESESEASRYKKLHALKAKIAKLPKEKMQIVVDIVEESGNYELTDESFDFDLHLADALTITRLQQLVS